MAQVNDTPLKGYIRSINHKTFLVIDGKLSTMPKYHHIKTYNKVSQKVESEYHYGDDSSWDTKIIYTYNSKRYVATKKTYKQGNIIGNVLKYEYDYRGNLVKEKKINARGSELYDIKYVYDGRDRLLSKTQKFYGINLLVKESYEYNAQNKISKTIKTDVDGTTYTMFMYKDGELTDKADYDLTGKLYSNIIYSYNLQHDKTALYKFDNADKLTYFEEYEYEYDPLGNWVKKITYEKGRKTMEEYRQIEYY